MSRESKATEDPWKTTTWEGNKEDQLDRALASSYEERFRWVCDSFEFLKDTIPKKMPEEGKL